MLISINKTKKILPLNHIDNEDKNNETKEILPLL